MRKKDNWEKEFIKRCEWVFHDPDCDKYQKIEIDDTGGKRIVGYVMKNDDCSGEWKRRTVLSFIRSLLKSERERVIEEIENFEGTGIVKGRYEKYISIRELWNFLQTLKEKD